MDFTKSAISRARERGGCVYMTVRLCDRERGCLTERKCLCMIEIESGVNVPKSV